MIKLDSLYIILNAGLFLVFAGWCVVQPEFTSNAIGFSLSGDQGMAEYLAVYGGLQGGIGVFYALSLRTADSIIAALRFSVCLYGGLVLARLFAIYTHGNNLGFGWYYFALECVLLVSALALRRQR